MTFAVAIWIAICVWSTVFVVIELSHAERKYLAELDTARSDSDIHDATHRWKQSQSFLLAEWSTVCFTSGIAVFIVDMLTK